MIPILHSPGLMIPGQLGPMSLKVRIERGIAIPSLGLTHEGSLDPDHIVLGNTLCDTYYKVKLSFDSLKDSFSSKRRGYIDHTSVSSNLLDGLSTVLENGES